MCFGGLAPGPGSVAAFNEELGGLLNGVTFIAFGAILLGPALGELTWRVVLYAVLSLTLVRILPVAIALLGSGARRQTVGFIGWFGPRGLASIVFAVLIVEEAQLPHTDTILLATYTTIGLSVLAHGLSAAPSRGATPAGTRPTRMTVVHRWRAHPLPLTGPAARSRRPRRSPESEPDGVLAGHVLDPDGHDRRERRRRRFRTISARARRPCSG